MDVRFDQRSFIINGERVFLNSAAIHYFRMPKEEWRDVLTKAKLAGMNCIDTYFAWNAHEAEEGQFNFAGDLDCGYFLDLCAELGLWVIARPGPFICAEWDFGGFPWWLARKDGIEYRIDNEVYMHYVLKYFDQLLPIIAERQLSNSGTVILVQVENEYGYLAESERGKRYMAELKDAILARHITVPLITCVGGAEDTIECANFWSGAKEHYAKLVEKQPDTPKIVTEFWTGWFENWGGMSALQKTPLLYEKRILEVVAAGFDGINHYMFYGGTNFASYGGRTVGNSDIFMITSYDYHAPLDEYGRPTDKYFVAKKLSQFTTTLSSFLLDAAVADSSVIAHTGKLNIQLVEANDRQRLLFVENLEDERNVFHITLREQLTLPVTIEAGQMIPVLDQIEVLPGLRLTCGGYLLANESFANRQTLILSGGKGQRLSILLETDATSNEKAQLQWNDEQKSIVRHSWIKEKSALLLDMFLFEEAQVLTLQFGTRTIELIVLNEEAANQTWHVADPAVEWIIGYEDVALDEDGTIRGVQSEYRAPLWISPDQTVFIEPTPYLEVKRYPIPLLTNWKTITHNLAIEEEHTSERPLGLSELGQDFGYVVYTHELNSDKEECTRLAITAIQDPARVYVNGVEQGYIKDVGAASIDITLQEGNNTLQFVVQHMGRLNFSPYLGEEKGIFGTVHRNATVIDFRSGWKTDKGVYAIDQVTDLEAQTMMSNAFHVDEGQKVILVGVLSELLYINGQQVHIPGYANWFKFHTLDITPYVTTGENTITMQYVMNPVQRLELMLCNEADSLLQWNMTVIAEQYPAPLTNVTTAVEVLSTVGVTSTTGGYATVDASSTTGGYATIDVNAADGSSSLCLPSLHWHQAQFEWKPLGKYASPRLKLRMTGLSKGIIVLNGRHIGRYWQVGPQEDYKLPMSWINEGVNTLEILDEQGLKPDSIKIIYDKNSNKVWTDIHNNVKISK